jgi:predicted GIY-YIG superfamily endonuclease
MYHVYILRCADRSLYIGYTTNLLARVRAHNEGRGAAYTFKRRPVALIYTERLPSRLAALRRERQLKRWTRKKKEALIRGDWATLKALSKRRT